MCCLCTHFIYAHRFYACYFPTYTSCFYWTFISSCCRSTSTSCFTRGMGIVKRSCIIRICALDSFSIRSWSTQLFCVIRLLMWVEKCTNYTSSSLNPFIIQSYQRSITHPLHHVFRQLSHRTTIFLFKLCSKCMLQNGHRNAISLAFFCDEIYFFLRHLLLHF